METEAVGLAAETEAAGLVECNTVVAAECCCSWSAGKEVVVADWAAETEVAGCTPGSEVGTEAAASAEVVGSAAVKVGSVAAGLAVAGSVAD